MKELRNQTNKQTKAEYYNIYYEKNKETMNEKARDYSRVIYYPNNREQKLIKVKAYQAKLKGELIEENIFFIRLN